jgi:flagellar assembly factor FliW
VEAAAAGEIVTTSAAVTLRSRRFGTYDVPADRVVELADGLVGLPHLRRFALLEPAQDGSPFRYLVSFDEPEIGFLVCDPEAFFPGYALRLPRSAGVGPESAVLTIVTVPAEARRMTANLMAPLVIDGTTRSGRQIVLESGGWSTRHPLLAGTESAPSAETR